MRSLTVALGLLLLSTPAFAMGAKKPVVKAPAPVIVEPARDVQPSQPLPVFLVVGKCDNCSVAEFDHIKASVVKVNDVVSGQCFREKMLAMDLIQTEGRTPAQVVDSLKGVKIDTEMYWTIKRVLGYTLPSAQKIWINRRYMLQWNHCDLGSLLAHESSHKVGYGHDYQSTSRRPKSVPYSINRAFDACCTK